MKPIVTITLNPAVDLTIEVAGLVKGGVNRAERSQTNAGGKGVNVAGCAADWRGQVTVTGVLGRGNDGAFVELFATKGISDKFIRVAGDYAHQHQDRRHSRRRDHRSQRAGSGGGCRLPRPRHRRRARRRQGPARSW